MDHFWGGERYIYTIMMSKLIINTGNYQPAVPFLIKRVTWIPAIYQMKP